MDIRLKRKKEFKFWLDTYYDSIDQNKFSVINDADTILNETYWFIAETFVRPRIQDLSIDDEQRNINRFKIISATEFSVISVLPFIEKSSTESDESSDFFDENEEVRTINAKFAWFIAISIMNSWHIDNSKQSNQNHYSKDNIKTIANYKDINNEKGLTIQEEHINWLTYFNRSGSFPIFSNSQFWRMFEYCLNIDKS